MKLRGIINFYSFIKNYTQGLKAFTPKSGVRISGDAISTPRGLDLNFGEGELCRKIGKNTYKRSSAWCKEYRQK